MDLETKFCRFETEITVTEGCRIEGYASRFGACDQGGDVVVRGAYGASLSRLGAEGRAVKMLWQHDPAQPIGIWDEVREDAEGLYVKGRLLDSIAKGREAAALIGCDLVVAAGDETIGKLYLDRAVAVSDTTVVPTSEFARNPDWQLNGDEQLARLTRVLGDRARGIDAQGLAAKLLGDSVYANMLLVGAAWQQGGLPLSLEAIERAIELNGVKVAQNRRAFDLGRLAYATPDAVAAMLRGTEAPVLLSARRPKTLDERLDRRLPELRDIGGAAMQARYRDKVQAVARAAEAAGLDDTLARSVAQYYYKLLAVKDEWEVARLYSKPSFKAALAEAFEGKPELTFHFGAWPFGGVDPRPGKAVKGPVSGKLAMRFFRAMNSLRFLRGTVFDPFRNTDEVKLAAQLLADYEADLALVLALLGKGQPSPAQREAAEALLALPEHIRGYGHVRERHAREVAPKREKLRAALHAHDAAAA